LRVKLSIVALLGLGIFASTAAIVRLTVTLNLSATTDFLYYAMPVAAWAHAELGLGVILANLAALRPLIEKVLKLRFTLRSSGKRSSSKRTDNPTTIDDRYMELEEGTGSNKSASRFGNNKGLETKIYGGDLADDNSSLGGDDRSTKGIVTVDQSHHANGILADHQIHVSRGEARES
jgi:hypothetical protein